MTKYIVQHMSFPDDEPEEGDPKDLCVYAVLTFEGRDHSHAARKYIEEQAHQLTELATYFNHRLVVTEINCTSCHTMTGPHKVFKIVPPRTKFSVEEIPDA